MSILDINSELGDAVEKRDCVGKKGDCSVVTSIEDYEAELASGVIDPYGNGEGIDVSVIADALSIIIKQLDELNRKVDKTYMENPETEKQGNKI